MQNSFQITILTALIYIVRQNDVPILKQWIFYNCNSKLAGKNHITAANCNKVYTAYFKSEDIFI